MAHLPEPLRAIELSLLGDIWSSRSAWPTIRMLCDDFNGRFVGSDDERKAAAFICDRLDVHGLSDVYIAHCEDLLRSQGRCRFGKPGKSGTSRSKSARR